MCMIDKHNAQKEYYKTKKRGIKMKRKAKNEIGVTLVALIVTIVVLLILAGITIGSITSDNGIIKEANSAKKSAEMQALESQIEMAIIKVEQKHRNPTLDQVIEEIIKIEHVEGVNRETGAIKNDLGDDIIGKLDDYIKKENAGGDIEIITQPSNIETISNTEDIQFKVEVRAEGTVTYQWYQNSTNNNSEGTAIQEATEATYEIKATNVTSSLSGKYYYCEVTQEYGGSTKTITSDAAKLNVVSSVIITKQPTSITVVTSTGAAFSVTASGIGTLSYQWYYNTTNSTTGGTAIQGATSSSYTMPAGVITANMSGRYYYCIVTQKYGDATASVTSNTALLRVKLSGAELLRNKKVIIIGDRDGIPGPTIGQCIETTEADVIFTTTVISYATAGVGLEPDIQRRIMDFANMYGSENLIVILGSPDGEVAQILAETVTLGDPTFTGLLAGVELKIMPYHILEDEIKEVIDPEVWEDQVAMMEYVMDKDDIVANMTEIRDRAFN